MIPLTLAEVADVVSGRVVGDPDVVVSGPATLDSRAVAAGGLFVAVAGEQVDGHDYAAAAVEGGAAAVLASRDVGVPAVVVDDVTAALGRLARHVLDVVGPTVVALTGSQGKTSVKDLLAHLLATSADDPATVVATAGNHNNELGVPLTVLRADASTEVLVVEMGARGVGHVAHLCTIAPPDVSIVLNVGTAHVGEFGSVEHIAVAKGEIVEALRPGGTAVLNADDARVDAMAERVVEGVHVVRFGRTATALADVRVVQVQLDAAGEPHVTLAWEDDEWTVHVPLVGEHHAVNLAAATAAAFALGRTDAGTHLADYRQSSPRRMERHRRDDGVVVIDDTYNANPESTVAALRGLAAVRAGRRVAVLGEMLELGDGAATAHRAVGTEAADLGIDLVVAVGPGAAEVAAGAGDGHAVAVDDVEAAVALLRPWLAPDDVVLVKASRGAALERVTSALLST